MGLSLGPQGGAGLFSPSAPSAGWGHKPAPLFATWQPWGGRAGHSPGELTGDEVCHRGSGHKKSLLRPQDPCSLALQLCRGEKHGGREGGEHLLALGGRWGEVGSPQVQAAAPSPPTLEKSSSGVPIPAAPWAGGGCRQGPHRGGRCGAAAPPRLCRARSPPLTAGSSP